MSPHLCILSLHSRPTASLPEITPDACTGSTDRSLVRKEEPPPRLQGQKSVAPDNEAIESLRLARDRSKTSTPVKIWRAIECLCFPDFDPGVRGKRLSDGSVETKTPEFSRRRRFLDTS